MQFLIVAILLGVLYGCGNGSDNDLTKTNTTIIYGNYTGRK